MPYLTQLEGVARRAALSADAELDISPRWKIRGAGPMAQIRTVVVHHTASGGTYDYSLKLVRDGRPGLENALSHFGIGRSGRIYLIAAGLCWHAGRVGDPSFANAHAIGIEAMNNGIDEPWSDALMRSYRALCRELIAEFNLDVTRVLGHKEVCNPPGRKSDPNFSMAAFRGSILGADAQPPSPPAPPEPAHKEIDMLLCNDFSDRVWLITGDARRPIGDPAVVHGLNEAGVPNIGRVASNFLAGFPVAVDPLDVATQLRTELLAAIRANVPAGVDAELLATKVADELADRLTA